MEKFEIDSVKEGGYVRKQRNGCFETEMSRYETLVFCNNALQPDRNYKEGRGHEVVLD